jgi:hypothetical protein
MVGGESGIVGGLKLEDGEIKGLNIGNSAFI